jgi:aminoglycoside phosphotransferase (APT) family kinase protein
MSALVTDQLTEILSDEEKIRSERRENDIDDSHFVIEEFEELYSAILHLVDNVTLLDIWKPSFSLSHPDMTGHNILVGYDDPTHIVGIIDWEGARIQPWVGVFHES